MDENFQNYISFFKSEKYHSSSPISKQKTQYLDDETFRSEQSKLKWKNEKLWPQKQFVLTSELDPCQIFNGRLVDDKGKAQLPVELNKRNLKLNRYINQNLKHKNHEKLLPNILNHKYFGDTKKINQKHQDQLILNRLNNKSQDIRDQDTSIQQKQSELSQLMSKILIDNQNNSKLFSSDNTKIHINIHVGKQIAKQKDDQSQSTQQEINISNQQNSELFCKESDIDHNKVQHNQLNKQNENSQVQMQNKQRYNKHYKKSEDTIIKRLKNNSIIKKNGLVLECIMRDRGQQQEENNITTELFQQLRDIQQKEGTYKYQGKTLLPGSRKNVLKITNKT